MKLIILATMNVKLLTFTFCKVVGHQIWGKVLVLFRFFHRSFLNLRVKKYENCSIFAEVIAKIKAQIWAGSRAPLPPLTLTTAITDDFSILAFLHPFKVQTQNILLQLSAICNPLRDITAINVDPSQSLGVRARLPKISRTWLCPSLIVYIRLRFGWKGNKIALSLYHNIIMPKWTWQAKNFGGGDIYITVLSVPKFLGTHPSSLRDRRTDDCVCDSPSNMADIIIIITSCARGDTICLCPLQAWQYLRIYSPGGTCSGMLAI